MGQTQRRTSLSYTRFVAPHTMHQTRHVTWCKVLLLRHPRKIGPHATQLGKASGVGGYCEWFGNALCHQRNTHSYTYTVACKYYRNTQLTLYSLTPPLSSARPHTHAILTSIGWTHLLDPPATMISQPSLPLPSCQSPPTTNTQQEASIQMAQTHSRTSFVVATICRTTHTHAHTHTTHQLRHGT